jgi:hypothetical protein
MSEPHLHNKIGDVIRDCKKRLYRSLKLGADLELAIKCFLEDLTREFGVIVKGERRTVEIQQQSRSVSVPKA